MTRETKIGLVVACSFLCLVGVVVASKWKRGDDPSEEQTVVIAANKPAQNGTAPEKILEPAKKTESPAGEKSGSPAFPSLPPMIAIAPPGGNDAQIQQHLKEATKSVEHVGAIALPMPPVVKPDLPAPGPIQFVENKPQAKDGGPSFPALPLPPVEKKDAFAPSSPLNVAKKDVPAIPALVGAGGVDAGKPAFFIEEKKTPLIPPPETPKPGVPGTIEVPPPLSPVGKESPAVKPGELQPLPPLKDVPVVGIPSGPLKPLNQEPPAVIGSRELPSTPSIGTNPVIPPISVRPDNPLTPIVKESSPSIYECRQGDNTLSIVSLRVYGTDKYADALTAYNRTHAGPSGIKNSAFLNFSPPILNPGQQVLTPGKDILDRDYGTLIRQASITPPPAVPPGATVKLTPPTPLTPSTGDVSPVSVPPSIGAAGKYVVQNPNGESILDIAERQLGNRGRWTDIYRLNQANPTVQPQFRIPVGTELKMPTS